MNNEYWEVKRNCYACICITPEFNGSCIVWNTLEEAYAALKQFECYLQEDLIFYGVIKCTGNNPLSHICHLN